MHWLRHGAQPSETVSKLLTITGAWDEFRAQREPEAAAAEQTPPEVAAAPPEPDLVLDDAPAEEEDSQ